MTNHDELLVCGQIRSATKKGLVSFQTKKKVGAICMRRARSIQCCCKPRCHSVPLRLCHPSCHFQIFLFLLKSKPLRVSFGGCSVDLNSRFIFERKLLYVCKNLISLQRKYYVRKHYVMGHGIWPWTEVPPAMTSRRSSARERWCVCILLVPGLPAENVHAC